MKAEGKRRNEQKPEAIFEEISIQGEGGGSNESSYKSKSSSFDMETAIIHSLSSYSHGQSLYEACADHVLLIVKSSS